MKRLKEVLRENFRLWVSLLLLGLSLLVHLGMIFMFPDVHNPPLNWNGLSLMSAILGFVFGVLQIIPVDYHKESSLLQRSIFRVCGFCYFAIPIFTGGAIALLILT